MAALILSITAWMMRNYPIFQGIARPDEGKLIHVSHTLGYDHLQFLPPTRTKRERDSKRYTAVVSELAGSSVGSPSRSSSQLPPQESIADKRYSHSLSACLFGNRVELG
jgi:hypothetical protein